LTDADVFASADKIIEVKKGATTAHIRIDIGGQIMTALPMNRLTR
jgi:molybdopterin-binding protein